MSDDLATPPLAGVLPVSAMSFLCSPQRSGEDGCSTFHSGHEHGSNGWCCPESVDTY